MIKKQNPKTIQQNVTPGSKRYFETLYNQSTKYFNKKHQFKMGKDNTKTNWTTKILVES